MTKRLPIQFRTECYFPSIVFSHGWCSLAPFNVSESPLTLQRILRLPRDSLVSVSIAHRIAATPSVQVESLSDLTPYNRKILRESVRSILNLSQDLTPFYDRVRSDPRFSWAEAYGVGRMLRGETFFEDAVKTILTTNCSWSLTTAMNNNLVRQFGTKNRKGWQAFPKPEQIADEPADFLRTKCKLGYRAEYVYELAYRCASGKLDIELFRSRNAPASELYRELLSIKGIGEYAAANLLRLLGKFEYLGLDSWCRAKIAELHGNGVPLGDTEIEKIYAPYEEWKGLAMWLDVTRYWYDEKFPLI